VGGPFFRDINSNNGGDYTSLTHYMNSGHANPEAFRLGLHGPYMLTFTRSGIPKVNDFDLSWLADLDLTGYVSSSGRGSISGTASGVGNNGVVHWSNTEAQYWAYVASDGSFKSPAMKSGTYITKLYSTELEVANSSIVVTAGPDTNQDIENSLPAPSSSLWTIGVCDGQPTGFLNADKQQRMHPSDARMSAWGPLTYAVGSSELSDMPMALFKGFNTPQTITFSLSSADASGGATLRVRTTLSFAGARPQVTVNSWSGPSQKSPVNLNSRGVTRGTYRGLGEFYEFEIPSGTLVSGENTVKVDVTSGSSGDAFLSPNFVSFQVSHMLL
jgi:rhamnogalacturonan endolyase